MLKRISSPMIRIMLRRSALVASQASAARPRRSEKTRARMAASLRATVAR